MYLYFLSNYAYKKTKISNDSRFASLYTLYIHICNFDKQVIGSEFHRMLTQCNRKIMHMYHLLYIKKASACLFRAKKETCFGCFGCKRIVRSLSLPGG